MEEEGLKTLTYPSIESISKDGHNIDEYVEVESVRIIWEIVKKIIGSMENIV